MRRPEARDWMMVSAVTAFAPPALLYPSLRGALATKQSSFLFLRQPKLDCFADARNDGERAEFRLLPSNSGMILLSDMVPRPVRCGRLTSSARWHPRPRPGVARW